jgi:competence CoiA-like predicted nuclease
MQIAINEHGERIYPYKNGRATCQLCRGTLIAHCGEIRRHHWQHFGERDVDCDSWKEPETEWHRAWKERFPKEWREIVIGNHRADVKTPHGLVMEFQNSPISPAVIREREEFYDYMLWVVNAAHFDENLVFRSRVKSHLKRHEESTKYEVREAINEVEKEIREATAERQQVYREISDAERDVRLKKDDIKKFEGYFPESRNIAVRVAQYTPEDFTYRHWGDPAPQIHATVDHNLTNEVLELLRGKKQIEKEVAETQSLLNVIYKYPDFDLEGVTYKQVAYKDLNTKNYHKAKLVSKPSMHQLFPDVRQFASETDFLTFQYKQKQDGFILIVDLNQRIKELEETLAASQKEFENVSGKLDASLGILEEDVIVWIANQLDIRQRELQALEESLEAVQQKYQRYKDREERLEKEKPTRINAVWEEIENEREKEKGQIMQTFKWRYTLDWKYERKSWQAAEALLYFDTGRGYLFVQELGGSDFKKVAIEDFVAEILDLAKRFKK